MGGFIPIAAATYRCARAAVVGRIGCGLVYRKRPLFGGPSPHAAEGSAAIIARMDLSGNTREKRSDAARSTGAVFYGIYANM